MAVFKQQNYGTKYKNVHAILDILIIITIVLTFWLIPSDLT